MGRFGVWVEVFFVQKQAEIVGIAFHRLEFFEMKHLGQRPGSDCALWRCQKKTGFRRDFMIDAVVH